MNEREQGRAFPGRRFDGPQFRRLREGMRLSQAEAGRRTGVAQPLISLYERGGATPRHDKLHSLASLVGVTPDELLKAA